MNIFILQGAVLGFSAFIQPGPFLAYLLSETLAHGFRRTWAAAFAPLLSDGPIIALSLLVLTNMPAWLQRGMHFASGAFILFLAWKAYQHWAHFNDTAAIPAQAGSQSLVRAALMNAISPMPYIYWGLVTGPILVNGWRTSPIDGIGFLCSFYGVMICGLLAIMTLFNAARGLGAQISRWLLGGSVVAMAIFGIFQVWSGLRG